MNTTRQTVNRSSLAARAGGAAAALLLCAGPALASWVYRFPDGETVGYWDDAERWTNDAGEHKVPTGSDGYCTWPGTIYVTNSVPYIWGFDLAAPVTGDPLTLHFKEGAVTDESGTGWTGLRVGRNANEHGLVLIDAGATYRGGLTVGNGGLGVVTNRGTIKYNGNIILGNMAGSTGRLVCCDGGTVSPTYAKDLYVGRQGRGELLVRNTTNDWFYWSAKNGDVVVGESSAGGAITVEEGGSFKASVTYLGGRDAGAAGVGELVLRGGTFVNAMDVPVAATSNPALRNFTLGACPSADGGFDPSSHGVIRGWGKVVGGDKGRTGSRGIRMAVVSGEIVGDGEGDESRALNTHHGVFFVSNAVPETAGETTSGWRAVNKGLVTLPAANYYWNGEQFTNLVGYPGCAVEKDADGLLPDLVNALRVRLTRSAPGADKCIGVALLAPDRTDAHTNALPAGCNVLSVHRVGMFGYETWRDDAAKVQVSEANVAVRYDQTRILKDDTRLELWRYAAADGRWTRLVALARGERPASKVIAMADGDWVGSLDETYNLGTFAVVERERKGFAIIVR